MTDRAAFDDWISAPKRRWLRDHHHEACWAAWQAASTRGMTQVGVVERDPLMSVRFNAPSGFGTKLPAGTAVFARMPPK